MIFNVQRLAKNISIFDISKGSEKDGVKKLTKHLLITDHQNNARECLDIRNFIFAVTKTKLNIPSGCDTNAIVYLKQIIAGLRQESR